MILGNRGLVRQEGLCKSSRSSMYKGHMDKGKVGRFQGERGDGCGGGKMETTVLEQQFKKPLGSKKDYSIRSRSLGKHVDSVYIPGTYTHFTVG